MGFSLKKFFKVLIAPINLILKPLLSLLPGPKTPSVPKALEGGKTFNADFRINDSKIGDPRQEVYGQTVVWGQEASKTWSEYDGKDEIRNSLLHLSGGSGQVLAARLGGTPVSALSGTRLEVLPPGIRNELFHSNVYTSPDAKDLDLIGGALNSYAVTGEMSFNADINQIVIGDYNEALAAIGEGQTITIAGTANNNGTAVVLRSEVFSDGESLGGSFLTVDRALVNELVTCTISADQESGDAKTLATDPGEFTFNAALSQLSGAMDALVDFRSGDVIGARNGVVANAGQSWTVLDTLGGTGLVLSGTVVDEVATCSIYLKRRRVGPYPACPPGAQVSRFGVHIFAPNGLLRSKDDRFITAGVGLMIRHRPIDDAGTPLGPWVERAASVANADPTPFRKTLYFDLSSPARIEVDGCRISQKSDDTNIRDDVVLGGLIGFIANRAGEDPAVDTECTRVALQVRGSGQLSRLAENAANFDFQRELPVWNGTTWSAPQATRSIAWAAADWLTTTSRGAITRDNLDLDSFLAFDAACTAAGDTFDGVIDQIPQLLEGANAILAAGRAQLNRDPLTGQYTIYRDQPVAPAQLLADEFNCTLGGEEIETTTTDSVTGIQVQWFDPLTRAMRDGPVVGDDTDPEVIDMLGLSTWDAAWRMANYEYLRGKLRVLSLSADCEMEALLLNVGDRVLVVSDRKRYGQGRKVLSLSGTYMEVWPPLDWTPGAQHYLYLQGRDGRPGARINCYRYTSDSKLILATPSDVSVRDADDQAPMLIAFGHDAAGSTPANGPLMALVAEVRPDGLRSGSVSLLVDDERVHADPGPAPTDPNALNGTIPVLAIAGLTLSVDGAVVTAEWDAVVVPEATPIYELAWRYAGALAWTTVRRGVSNSGSFVVAVSGPVQVRVRGLVAGRLIREAVAALNVTAGAGPLTVTVAPSGVYGVGPNGGITTSTLSGSVTGGVLPYSYAWEFVSGDAASFTAPNSASTAVRAVGVLRGESKAGSVRLRVTDAAATVAYSPARDWQVSRTGSGTL